MKNPFKSQLPTWFGGLLLIIGLIVFPNSMGWILLSYEENVKFSFGGLLVFDSLKDMIQLSFAYTGFAMSVWFMFWGISIIIFHDKKADIEPTEP